MKIKKTVLVALFVILSLALFSTVAFAYTLLPYKWQGSTPIYLTYKHSSFTNTGNSGINAFNSALNDWNSCQSKIVLTFSSASSNTLDDYSLYSTSEYGRCDYAYNGTAMVWFHAFVNGGNTHIYESNVMRSAACHELGHGGATLNESIASCLMFGGRDRHYLYNPVQDDIAGINAQYP